MKNLPVSEKTRRALKDFALTDYEAKAYVALVGSGALAASELSRVAAIPYSKIYEILGNLERKGWVESAQGRPSRYYPKAPSTALESSRVRFETNMKSSQADALQELQPLYEKKGVQEKPDIWIVRGQDNILDKIKETLGRTRRELMVAMPVAPEPIVSIALPILSLMKEKGVKIFAMLPETASKELIRRLRTVVEVRTRQQMFGGGIISDDNQIILLLGEEPEKGLTLAISSEHVGLVRFGKSYFEYLWESSKPQPDLQ